MLEIRPIADEGSREILAARYRIPYAKGDLLYGADQDGTVVAVCRFNVPRAKKESFETVTLLSLAHSEESGSDIERIEHLLLLGVIAFCLQNRTKTFRTSKSSGISEATLLACGLSRREDGTFGLGRP